ncbi:glycoside hydrolase family 3 protein [Streptomyces sp. NPDC005876]|uniref:glycoside hydrolase family 3 protein n=1 Tax=Streptomyces sp. NPDC005876 TaxID=3157076 RepID=UPI0033F65F30
MPDSSTGSTGSTARPSRRTVLAAGAGVTAALAAGGTASARPAAPAGEARLRSLVSRMTLEEKVGQLFVMRVYGHSATAPDQADIDANLAEIGVRTAAELIARYRVGGIIYFAWAHNTRDPRQIAALSNGIQKASLAQERGLPVLISTDQEHGAVARVGEPATLFPGAMAIGAGRSRADARRLGRIAGAELRAMGIRQDYAPVADVNVNPANPVIGVRSFGADPGAVASLVAAEVTGYQGSGVAACAKHFPGHGDTAVDSHTGFPVITHSRAQWEELDAPPFRAAIAAGIDSIMTAHLMVPALDDSGDPATLSRPIVTGLLREELGYDGVVVTDSLGMEGVRTKYGDERVPVLALKAGVDQLLNPPDLDLAWNGVLTAVRNGELSEARLEESILRVLRLKAKLGLFRDPYTSAREVDRTVGTRAHLAAADRIAERTTTLLVNEGDLLPLSRRRTPRLLVVGADPASPSGTTGPPTTVLAGALTELGFTATALSTGTAPTSATVARAVAAAGGADAVVVTTYNVTATSGQRTLVRELLATGRPVVAVAVRNPYDVARLPDVPAVLAAYSWTDVEVRAAARVIAGRAEPRGRLPVPVVRADDPATVLYPVGYGLTYRS